MRGLTNHRSKSGSMSLANHGIRLTHPSMISATCILDWGALKRKKVKSATFGPIGNAFLVPGLCGKVSIFIFLWVQETDRPVGFYSTWLSWNYLNFITLDTFGKSALFKVPKNGTSVRKTKNGDHFFLTLTPFQNRRADMCVVHCADSQFLSWNTKFFTN